MSKPEPPPINKGLIVPDELIKFLIQDDTIHNSAIQLIQERDQFGFKKYGQHLRTQDGRDDIEDARQEMGDLMQYVFKAKLNNLDLSEIRVLAKTLNILLKE